MNPLASNELLIRVDASSTAGAGHLMRCLALAHEWNAQGGHVTFRVNPEAVNFPFHLRSQGIAAHVALPDCGKKKDSHSTIDLAQSIDASWVVIDGYTFDEDFICEIHSSGRRVLVIEDANRLQKYHCQVLLSPTPGSEEDQFCASPDTLFLLGTTYFLLRSEFSHAASNSKFHDADVKCIMISMGGSDPDNITSTAMRLLEHPAIPPLTIKIVIGPHFNGRDDLDATLSSSKHNIEVIASPDNVESIFQSADMAVSSAGTTAMELAYLGVPTILVALAENQIRNAQYLQQTGAACYLGMANSLNANTFREAILALINSESRRRSMRSSAVGIIDGRGATRTVTIMKALSTIGLDICSYIRKATLHDAVQLWHLANDPNVRANAFIAEPIPLPNHLEWFNAKLISSGSRIWVIDIGGAIAGQIRYDRKAADFAEIDFSIHPAFRGKGFGTALLRHTAEQAQYELSVPQVIGFVKQANKASSKAFVKAGFRHAGLVMKGHENCDKFVY